MTVFHCRTLPLYCGVFAMTSFSPSSSSAMMKMGVWMDEAVLVLTHPRNAQLSLPPVQARNVNREEIMNESAALFNLISSLYRPPSPSHFFYPHFSVWEREIARESESGAVAVQIMGCNPQAEWVWMTVTLHTPPFFPLHRMGGWMFQVCTCNGDRSH